MTYTEKELQERVDAFCKEPKPFFLSGERDFVKDLLSDLLREDDSSPKAVLFAGIFKIVIASNADMDDIAFMLREIGFEAYAQKENELAEAAFKGAVIIKSDITDRNNLAYIMRKSGNSTGMRIKEMIDYLSDGVQQKEPFCLINMALIFSLSLGTEKDWEIADELMSLVDADSSAVHWWKDLGEQNDIEGYLVHLWLQNHRILSESELGTRQYLIEKVNSAYPNAPHWLIDADSAEHP